MFGRSRTAQDERSRTDAEDTRYRDDTVDRTDERTTGRHAGDTTDVRDGRAVDPVAAQEVRKERFGGLNGGAAFFGWLVAVAVSVLLSGIVSAIVAAVGSSAQVTQQQAQSQIGNIGLAAAIVLLVVLMIGYYCGGYVAGRMSRFSGGSQGLGVWITGVIVTVLMIVLGAIFGSQYDIFNRVNLPRLPISTSSLTTGGIVAAVLVLAGTLVAALLGGSVGTHYHRRVDRAGWNA
jgi:membrane protease YdiL (CAAX protease family)